LRVDVGADSRNTNAINGVMRPKDDSFRSRFIYFVLWMHRSVEDIASHLERMVTAVYEGQIHEMCPHNQSCVDYWLEVNMVNKFKHPEAPKLCIQFTKYPFVIHDFT